MEKYFEKARRDQHQLDLEIVDVLSLLEENSEKRKKKVENKFFSIRKNTKVVSRYGLTRQYVPRFVINLLAERGEPIKNAHEEIFHGCCMFADVSGFTKLTRKLMQDVSLRERQTMGGSGDGARMLDVELKQTVERGAEELVRHLNKYFGEIIRIIEMFGGDVIKFAGDALLVVFNARPRDAGEEPNAATMKEQVGRAVRCSEVLHNIDSRLRTVDTVELKLHIGLGAGKMRFVFVGGMHKRWEYLVADCEATDGPVQQIAIAEGNAEPDETVMHAKAFNAYMGGKDGGDFASKCHEILAPPKRGYSGEPPVIAYRLTILKRQPWEKSADLEALPSSSTTILPQRQKRGHRSNSDDENDEEGGKKIPGEVLDWCENFIPGSIKKFLEPTVRGFGGVSADKIGDLRRVSVLFVNLKGLRPANHDYLAKLQETMIILQDCLYAEEGSVNKFIADDKGTTLIAGFGLPPLAHRDDPLRAVRAAIRISSRLNSAGVSPGGSSASNVASLFDVNAGRVLPSIGVTTGNCFCGIVGGSRQEYTMMGDVVNLSARLMQKAVGGSILVDLNTYKESQQDIDYDILPEIHVKGFNEPIQVFAPDPAGTKCLAVNLVVNDVRTAFVGRQSQLDMLKRSVQRFYIGWDPQAAAWQLEGGAPSNTAGTEEARERTSSDKAADHGENGQEVVATNASGGIADQRVGQQLAGKCDVVRITGPFGVGKSRLLDELLNHIGGEVDGPPAAVVMGVASFDDAYVFSAFIPIVLNLLQIWEDLEGSNDGVTAVASKTGDAAESEAEDIPSMLPIVSISAASVDKISVDQDAGGKDGNNSVVNNGGKEGTKATLSNFVPRIRKTRSRQIVEMHQRLRRKGTIEASTAVAGHVDDNSLDSSGQQEFSESVRVETSRYQRVRNIMPTYVSRDYGPGTRGGGARGRLDGFLSSIGKADDVHMHTAIDLFIEVLGLGSNEDKNKGSGDGDGEGNTGDVDEYDEFQDHGPASLVKLEQAEANQMLVADLIVLLASEVARRHPLVIAIENANFMREESWRLASQLATCTIQDRGGIKTSSSSSLPSSTQFKFMLCLVENELFRDPWNYDHLHPYYEVIEAAAPLPSPRSCQAGDDDGADAGASIGDDNRGSRSGLHVALEGMEGHDVVALAKAFWNVVYVPMEVLDVLVKRSEGFPLFAEKVMAELIRRKAVRCVQRTGGRGKVSFIQTAEPAHFHFSLPASLQTLLRAQLDALDHRPAQLLKLAAVVSSIGFPAINCFSKFLLNSLDTTEATAHAVHMKASTAHIRRRRSRGSSSSVSNIKMKNTLAVPGGTFGAGGTMSASAPDWMTMDECLDLLVSENFIEIIVPGYYRFKSPLFRDVIYRSILYNERAKTHDKVAARYEVYLQLRVVNMSREQNHVAGNDSLIGVAVSERGDKKAHGDSGDPLSMAHPKFRRAFALVADHYARGFSYKRAFLFSNRAGEAWCSAYQTRVAHYYLKQALECYARFQSARSVAASGNVIDSSNDGQIVLQYYYARTCHHIALALSREGQPPKALAFYERVLRHYKVNVPTSDAGARASVRKSRAFKRVIKRFNLCRTGRRSNDKSLRGLRNRQSGSSFDSVHVFAGAKRGTQADEQRLVAKTFTRVAVVYYEMQREDMGDWAAVNAINAFQKSIKNRTGEFTDIGLVAQAYAHACRALQGAGKAKRAAAYKRKALMYYEKLIESASQERARQTHQYAVVEVITAVAEYDIITGDWVSAERRLIESIDRSTALNDQRTWEIATINLGMVCLASGRPRLAAELLLAGGVSSQRRGASNLQNISLTGLGSALAALGHLEVARKLLSYRDERSQGAGRFSLSSAVKWALGDFQGAMLGIVKVDQHSGGDVSTPAMQTSGKGDAGDTPGSSGDHGSRTARLGSRGDHVQFWERYFNLCSILDVLLSQLCRIQFRIMELSAVSMVPARRNEQLMAQNVDEHDGQGGPEAEQSLERAESGIFTAFAETPRLSSPLASLGFSMGLLSSSPTSRERTASTGSNGTVDGQSESHNDRNNQRSSRTSTEGSTRSSTGATRASLFLPFQRTNRHSMFGSMVDDTDEISESTAVERASRIRATIGRTIAELEAFAVVHPFARPTVAVYAARKALCRRPTITPRDSTAPLERAIAAIAVAEEDGCLVAKDKDWVMILDTLASAHKVNKRVGDGGEASTRMSGTSTSEDDSPGKSGSKSGDFMLEKVLDLAARPSSSESGKEDSSSLSARQAAEKHTPRGKKRLSTGIAPILHELFMATIDPKVSDAQASDLENGQENEEASGNGSSTGAQVLPTYEHIDELSQCIGGEERGASTFATIEEAAAVTPIEKLVRRSYLMVLSRTCKDWSAITSDAGNADAIEELE